jgi:hypothetical protein
MTDELERLLTEKARQEFGSARLEELKQDIEKLAVDLREIQKYPLNIEDEP